jgi:beta-N-acetylhexosaminidase
LHLPSNLFLPLLLVLSSRGFSFQQYDSLHIKVGQMIMIGINARTSVSDTDTICRELREYRAGGVIIFEKNISKSQPKEALKKLTKNLHKNSKLPLLISIDEEGGKVHRLHEKYGFVSMPSAGYLGTLNNQDSTLFYNRRLAAELREYGINFNYAPTLDLAINPKNTVIVTRGRSFSNDPAIVSRHAMICIGAHHENRVRTILKHFPGHGSSTSDSHHGIVNVTDTWNFKELLPYHEIIESSSADAIMTAHIINRNWDTTMLPATLSKNVVTGILRGLLGYKGVVVSDDMQMFAISRNYGLENAIELSINAGVDMLMFGNNVSAQDPPISATEIHNIIMKLVNEKKISRDRINESYGRIMRLKSLLPQIN